MPTSRPPSCTARSPGCVLGADPADFDAISDRVIEDNYKFPWSFICRALAGVDTAIWDLLGKRAGKSVCALLGGTPRPLPVYGSSMSRTIQPDRRGRPPAATPRQARASGRSRSASARSAGTTRTSGRAAPQALVPAVRKALGDQRGPAGRRQQLLHAARRPSRSAACWKSTATATSRSRARTGSWNGRPRWRRP